MIRGTTIAFVIVAAAGTAVVVAPRLFSRGFGCSNDVCAWASLRNLESVEREVREAARIDLDRDSVGEFAFPGELSGARLLPGGDPRYSGENGPLPGAAFEGGGVLSITGAARDGARGQDGNVWRPASRRP